MAGRIAAFPILTLSFGHCGRIPIHSGAHFEVQDTGFFKGHGQVLEQNVPGIFLMPKQIQILQLKCTQIAKYALKWAYYLHRYVLIGWTLIQDSHSCIYVHPMETSTKEK